jgi:hypothetical protein
MTLTDISLALINQTNR